MPNKKFLLAIAILSLVVGYLLGCTNQQQVYGFNIMVVPTYDPFAKPAWYKSIA